MTPNERMSYVAQAMQNSCVDGEHIYEDRVDTLLDGAMLSQICVKCFNIQGWVYSRE